MCLSRRREVGEVIAPHKFPRRRRRPTTVYSVTRAGASMKLTLSALPRDVIVRTLPALIRLLTTRTSQCSILAHITNVHDLMALRLTSRLMRDCLLAAPLRLALGSSKNGDVSVRLLGAAFPATVALTLPTQSTHHRAPRRLA